MRKVIGMVAAVVLLVFVVVALGRGVRVTVENVGSTALTDLVVKVTGATYDVGELGPGASETVRVLPTGESHVELTWKDAEGRACYGRVDCYFEGSGYKGTVAVELDGAAVKKAEADIGTGFF